MNRAKNRIRPSARIAFGLFSTAGLVLAGCTATPRGTPQNTYVGLEGSPEIEESIGSPDLERKFVLVGTRTERRDDRLHVQFELKNTTSSDLAIEWSLEWRDASGFRLDTLRHWTPVVVGGNGVEPIQQTSPVPEAVGFKLHIRKSSPVR